MADTSTRTQARTALAPPPADHGTPAPGVFLPGSWPCGGYTIAPDEATADTVEPLIREPLSIAAPELTCALGDGEPWRGYVMYQSWSLSKDPGIRVVRQGDWAD